MPERGKTHRTRSVKATLYDLLKAYADQRTRTLAKHSHVVKRREVWSIKDARAYLDRVMGASAPGEWVQLDLFLDQVLPTRHLSRTALAASFGASLEMARDGLVELQQEGPFAPIYIRKR
jgi:segregation and condensation protein A